MLQKVLGPLDRCRDGEMCRKLNKDWLPTVYYYVVVVVRHLSVVVNKTKVRTTNDKKIQENDL